jgi:hypothetical protein
LLPFDGGEEAGAEFVLDPPKPPWLFWFVFPEGVEGVEDGDEYLLDSLEEFEGAAPKPPLLVEGCVLAGEGL